MTFNNRTSYISIFVAALSIVMISGLFTASFVPLNSVLASTDQTGTDQTGTDQTGTDQNALETVDSHLEDCIEELENGNTDEALDNCQAADDELDMILGNSTG